jgi:hypothetical protein
MNSCDHGHETANETRGLPTGGSSGVIEQNLTAVDGNGGSKLKSFATTFETSRFPGLTIFRDPVEYDDVYIRLRSLPDPLPLARETVMIDGTQLYAFITRQLTDALTYETTFGGV